MKRKRKREGEVRDLVDILETKTLADVLGAVRFEKDPWNLCPFRGAGVDIDERGDLIRVV